MANSTRSSRLFLTFHKLLGSNSVCRAKGLPRHCQSIRPESTESRRTHAAMETFNGNGVTLNGNGCSSHEIQDYVENQVYKDGQLLQKVLDITLREKLMTKSDPSDKVVNFKYPHELQKALPLAFSSTGCKTVEEIEEIIEKVVSYSVKTTHPQYYNQLYGGVDEVCLMGSWLLEALNTNQHTFEVAPVFIILEHFMVKQLCELYGWQDGDGIFAPGGSISNMYGISLARHKKYPETKENGLFGAKKLVLLTSDMGHYSIEKAAAWMGFGTNQVVKVASDEYGRMRAKNLRNAIQKVREEGGEPFFVNATAGTTVLGAFDPLDELAEVCQEYSLWLHVDACWGGAVIMSDKHKHLLKGIERSDSIAWNPHKMICAPLQCSAFLVKHKGLLNDCNKVGASYLFQPDKFYDVEYDTGDKSIQCGRKADVLKLWIMFKVHGLDLFKARVDTAFEAASYLESEIEQREGFRLVLDERDCTNVCFWYIPPSLRNCEETQEWWMKVHKVAPAIKGRMANAGTLLVGYQPIESKKLVNFFRMVTTAFPISTKEEMRFVLDEIQRLGSDL